MPSRGPTIRRRSRPRPGGGVTEPRCRPAFPTQAVILDNSALSRLWKCGVLRCLRGVRRPRLVVAGHVEAEFRRIGPAGRAALDDLPLEVRRVGLNSSAWSTFQRIRSTEKTSTRDQGEDESIAVALVAADQGEILPFAIYDARAARRSGQEGLVTLDWLDTLSWLIGCGQLSVQQADDAEQRARDVDGWRPPPGYTGSIAAELTHRLTRVVAAVETLRASRGGR